VEVDEADFGHRGGGGGGWFVEAALNRRIFYEDLEVGAVGFVVLQVLGGAMA
jgi:hypothetical protein